MASVRWSALVLVACLGLTPRAHAQSSTDKAAAEALFDEGKRLMDAKRFAEACPKLADSQRLDPGVGTLLNLALCYKENGQTASAWSTYREAAAQARAARQDEREQLARDEATALEPRLTRLIIEVAPAAAETSGIVVKRDGAAVPPGLWNVAAPVDPGVRVIDVTAPGKKPLRLETKAEGPGATAKVVITALEDDPTGAATSPAPASATPTDPGPLPPNDAGSKPGSGQRVIGYVVGGLGIVGIAVGGVFTLKMMSENDSAKEICPDFPSGECTENDVNDQEDYVANAKASRLNALLAYGLGGVGIITGAVLIITAPSAEKPAGALRVTPELAEGGYGLRVSGTW